MRAEPDTGGATTTTADSDGTYTLQDLAPGSYEISASLDGFDGPADALEVEADGTTGHDLLLESAVARQFVVSSAVDLAQELSAGQTIDDVGVDVARDDGGAALDHRVDLMVPYEDGEHLDWPEPDEGLLTEATIDALRAALGTGDDDPRHTLNGDDAADILEVDLAVGFGAHEIAALRFDLIGDRFLPGAALHHERAEVELTVVPAPQMVDVPLHCGGTDGTWAVVEYSDAVACDDRPAVASQFTLDRGLLLPDLEADEIDCDFGDPEQIMLDWDTADLVGAEAIHYEEHDDAAHRVHRAGDPEARALTPDSAEIDD